MIRTVLIAVLIVVAGISLRIMGKTLPNAAPLIQVLPVAPSKNEVMEHRPVVQAAPAESEEDQPPVEAPPETKNLAEPLTDPSIADSTQEAPPVAINKDTTFQSSALGSRLGSKQNPISMIIHVSGELGNHVSKITYAYCLKWMLEEEFHIFSNILIEHQALSKWFHAARNVKLCFPNARDWSFEAANTDEFMLRREQQEEWMGSNHEYFHFFSICDQEDCIRNKTAFIVNNLDNRTGIPSIPDNHNITLPYISSDDYASLSYFNNRYYTRIKELWQFDDSNPNCCQERADPDESVFHVRGFLGEMPKRGKRMGYEELSPPKIAQQLFGHLEPGDKIAYTGRFPPEYMINYTNALQDRGLQVRVVMNHNPLFDFCFLMSAQKELAGTAMSSFVLWAAYLGNATQARLYSVKSPIRIDRFGNQSYFFQYNWTDPALDRIKFEEYNSEEQDEVDRKANESTRPRRRRRPPPSTNTTNS